MPMKARMNDAAKADAVTEASPTTSIAYAIILFVLNCFIVSPLVFTFAPDTTVSFGCRLFEQYGALERRMHTATDRKLMISERLSVAVSV
jgi:hypothetical protein